jgi:monoamine oxidase
MSRALRQLLRHGRRRNLSTKADFSRREIVRMGLGAAAGIALAPLLSGCSSTKKTPHRESAKGMRVCVIGAGFAGLACADTLTRAGADVTVLEASPRAGGRVLTDRKLIPHEPVEFGGEFIGENHPTWLSYAKRFKLDFEDAAEYETDYPVILGGKLLTPEEYDALYAEVDRMLAKFIEMAKPIDPIRPWTSPDAEALDKRSVLDVVNETELSETAKKFLVATEEADNGVTADKMSLLGYLAMVAGGGFKDYYELSESYRLKTGNDTLASKLANSLGTRVRLGSPVTAISRTSEAAIVTTEGGRAVEADAVVLAIAPTVWNKIRFESPLGGKIPQMGKNVKLILRVSRPIWEEQGVAPEAISDGLVNLTWVSAEPSRKSPASFTLFSGAADAEDLRTISTAERGRKAIESLKPAYPNLGDVATADRFLDWPSMPRFMASYGFPAPGEVCAYGPTLVDGVDDGLAPLRFAGEHTAYGFMGYMEGALSSGVRVAESLIESRATMKKPATQTA